MSLIDRGKVMNDYLENLGRADSYKAKYEALVKAIDYAPAVDAEPVTHSEWVWIPVAGVMTFRCGNIDCARLIPFGCQPSDLNYCPYCGAKMDAQC